MNDSNWQRRMAAMAEFCHSALPIAVIHRDSLHQTLEGEGEWQHRPRVWSHCRLIPRGTHYLSGSGIKRMDGSAKRQCDRTLPPSSRFIIAGGVRLGTPKACDHSMCRMLVDPTQQTILDNGDYGFHTVRKVSGPAGICRFCESVY
jgi:hypothetical protein